MFFGIFLYCGLHSRGSAPFRKRLFCWFDPRHKKTPFSSILRGARCEVRPPDAAFAKMQQYPVPLSFMPMIPAAPTSLLRVSDGLSSHTVTLKDLVDAKLLFPGDEMTFKHEKGTMGYISKARLLFAAFANHCAVPPIYWASAPAPQAHYSFPNCLP